MDKIAMINELYFEKKKSLTEIAQVIDTSVSYISRILRKDERYKTEKEKRKKDNLIQRRETQKELIYSKRKVEKNTDYIDMKRKHEEAAKELSKHSSIGNQDLRKWCSSAYKYNAKKRRYEFDTNNLLKPADFPMYIKT